MYQYAGKARKDTMEYPQIDRSSIWSVVEFVEASKKQPELLTDNSCPYPKEFLDFVRSVVNKDKAKGATTNSIEDLEDEIRNIYTELDDFKASLNSDSEGQVYVSYMRLRATLLTKMVEVKERVFNLRSMKLFQDRVLAGLDKICTPEQRTEFIAYLEGKA